MAPFLRWGDRPITSDHYSIVLGVPWDLRHLTCVNLRFVSKTNLAGLDEIVIVFDRTYRPEMRTLAAEITAAFPDLPIRFLWYPRVAGTIVEKINVSTFYNSLNVTLAIGTLRSKFAITHDFDLYPVDQDYFHRIWRKLRSDRLDFSGLELTYFQGLTDADYVIGTWSLGLDVDRLRSQWKPLDCFHRVARVRGRRIKLDPFSWIQLRSPNRALAGNIDSLACHVKNLCSTYLRMINGGPIHVAWRLHYLWYLEALAGNEMQLEEANRLMSKAHEKIITLSGRSIDFSAVHPTCANVLQREVTAMERHLFGDVRPDVEQYLAKSRKFFESSPHAGEDPSCVLDPVPETQAVRHSPASASRLR